MTTSDQTKRVRIDEQHRDVADSLIFPVKPQSSVEMVFDPCAHYNMHPAITALLRWVDFDRNEYYLKEAGPLDIAKLSLREILYDPTLNKVEIKLGSCSFYDIFYTHYCPDLVLSTVSTSESEDSKRVTLRSLFDGALLRYYTKQTSADIAPKIVCCSNLLPNPLGVSGIVLIDAGGSTFVPLKKRGSRQIASQNRLEWSFAGTIEAIDWIHDPRISFEAFIDSELDDELIRNTKTLKSHDPVIQPLGFVFNPLYLYQPEMFVAVRYKIEESKIQDLTRELEGGFVVVEVRHLSETFGKHTVKNLCFPGIKLLNIAYPELGLEASA